jgi:hypothetical protein
MQDLPYETPPISMKLRQFHDRSSSFRSMKLFRGNHASTVLLLCRFGGCETETERRKVVCLGERCLDGGTITSPSSSISANEPKSSTGTKGVFPSDESTLASSSSSSLILMKFFRRLDLGMRLAARERPSRHARASIRLFRF